MASVETLDFSGTLPLPLVAEFLARSETDTWLTFAGCCHWNFYHLVWHLCLAERWANTVHGCPGVPRMPPEQTIFGSVLT